MNTRELAPYLKGLLTQRLEKAPCREIPRSHDSSSNRQSAPSSGDHTADSKNPGGGLVPQAWELKCYSVAFFTMSSILQPKTSVAKLPL